MDISGNGLSWETAFKTIHEAVNKAGCLVEIFIKQGHYVIQEPIILQAIQTNIFMAVLLEMNIIVLIVLKI